MKEKYTKNIFLSLGTNLGDRLANLKTCLEFIEAEAGVVKKKSSIYETEAWGNKPQQAFLNRVVEIQSRQAPMQLLRTILRIEQQMGRVRNEKWEPRVIDIDILYFDHQQINNAELTVPHSLMTERKFVLIPLVEIAPDFEHPVLKKKNQSLLLECTDESTVKLFTN